jgi:hypothetical protein
MKDDDRFAGRVSAGLPIQAVAVADIEHAALVGLDLGKQAHRCNLTFLCPDLWR